MFLKRLTSITSLKVWKSSGVIIVCYEICSLFNKCCGISHVTDETGYTTCIAQVVVVCSTLAPLLYSHLSVQTNRTCSIPVHPFPPSLLYSMFLSPFTPSSNEQRSACHLSPVVLSAFMPVTEELINSGL